ncbi:MAG: UDP-N-acetylglucosamine 1-carboxyvinyltransferase [Ruminococcaceae bacterium]|nr:UDP-N-acetylglucosamine 1-carboxyvinyltransferase [Oscillospiraceae bacterium]
MPKLLINSGIRLDGTIDVQGAKNSLLPILAASLMGSGKSVIHNCPRLSDTQAATEILEELGCKTDFSNGTVYIDAGDAYKWEIPDNLMRKMRSSIVFLGAILGKFRKAKVSLPGGCELGPRPIDIHIEALRKMGVSVKDEYGYLYCECPKGLKGASIDLRLPSVGATENIMLCACCAEGTTVINNAAREPEIVDLQSFLVKMGAKITGAGTDTIIIEGVKKLNCAEHSVMPDRIVTATYLMCAAATGGRVKLCKTKYTDLSAVLSAMSDAGCRFKLYNDSIELLNAPVPKALNTVRTMPFPGFPTDAQALLCAYLTVATGTSIIVETVFQSRYKYIQELARMGAKIRTEDRLAIIDGVKYLTGSSVEATDLRGGAALVIAGLMAKGTTQIDKIFHIERGYENIEYALSSLGADIKKI